MIAIATKPLPDIGTWQLAARVDPATSTAIFADGQVLSVQPDGSQQKRPAGAAGPFEKCVINPLGLTYCPDSVHVYCFAMLPSLPNV